MTGSMIRFLGVAIGALIHIVGTVVWLAIKFILAVALVAGVGYFLLRYSGTI